MVPVSVCGARRMSLPAERLRPPPTAAHAAPSLLPPPAVLRLAAGLSPSVRAGDGLDLHFLPLGENRGSHQCLH